MNKKEFVKRLTPKLKKAGLSSNYEESRLITDLVLDEMFGVLSEGKSLYFKNFGRFHSVYRNFRVPGSGELMRTFVISFKPSLKLKNALKKWVK